MADFNAILVEQTGAAGIRGPAQIAPRTTRDKYALLMLGTPPAPASTQVSIQSMTSTSPTTWRVVFSNPVLDNVALRNAVNYTFSPDLDVVAVTPEAAAAPGYVDLETSEQKDGEAYTLTIHLVEAA